jgi:transposase
VFGPGQRGRVVDGIFEGHDHIPELVTLAETVSRWREPIAAAIILKVSNIASEGTNRVINARRPDRFRLP